MSKIQQLRPKDTFSPYTIKDLDNELICMAMVRSLGDEYSHFASSLLLFQSLEKDRLKEAFLAEELQHMWHPEATTVSEALPPIEYYNPGATLDSESECNEVLDHGGGAYTFTC